MTRKNINNNIVFAKKIILRLLFICVVATFVVHWFPSQVWAYNCVGGGSHSLRKIEKKEATCTEVGYEAYWQCYMCGRRFSDAVGTVEIVDSVEIQAGHRLKKIEGVAATAAKEGNSTYWYCDVCDKYFSDEKAEKEIKKEDTVLAKIAPVIIKGDGATVIAGEKKALSFTSDAACDDFIRVEVDGNTVDESNYTVKSGSIIVTLKEDYVASILEGEHTLGIVSESGTATAHFTVNKKTASTERSKTKTTSTTERSKTKTTSTTETTKTKTTSEKKTSTSTGTTTKSNPQTGDNSEIQLYVILMLASMCVLGGVCTKRRHKAWK